MKNKARGYTELKIGGQTRELRFRGNEIAMLEERLDMGISQIMSPDRMGLRILREAILVGVAHEFQGKKGKDARLSPQKISRWIDQYGDEGGDLGELMKVVYEAIALGLPGGDKMMEDEDEDEEGGEGEDNPLEIVAS